MAKPSTEPGKSSRARPRRKKNAGEAKSTEQNQPVEAVEDEEPPESAEVVAASAGDEDDPTEVSEAAAVDVVGEGESADEDQIEDTRGYLKGLLEALLFVSDRPLELKELARAARIDKKRTEELIAELSEEFSGRGFRIELVAGGLTFRSNPMYSAAVRNFLSQRPVRLSRAQIETLAIVAYRQPITRPEVDDIRGVDCGPVLKGLLERDLVRIIGKKDEPGRPMLYGTTPAFLELFSMQSLRDLPTLKEFTELSDESKQAFETRTGEEAPEGPVQTTEEAAEPTHSSDGEAETPEAETVEAETVEAEAETAAAAAETEAEPPADEDDEDEDEDDEDEDDEDDEDDDDDDDDED